MNSIYPDDASLRNAAFYGWMANVDADLARATGMTHKEMPDQLWRDWFEAGARATDAARDALRAEGFLP